MTDSPVQMIPLVEHLEKMAKADEKWMTERDRRYTDIQIEKDKATQLLAEKDRAALELAREIQTYKDEKANELRTQIERERGNYTTRGELRSAEDKLVAMIAPVIEFVNKQQGATRRSDSTAGYVFGALGLVIAIAAVVVAGLR